MALEDISLTAEEKKLLKTRLRIEQEHEAGFTDDILEIDGTDTMEPAAEAEWQEHKNDFYAALQIKNGGEKVGVRPVGGQYSRNGVVEINEDQGVLERLM